MEISNTRFGTVTVQPEDILFFPQGLIGFEACRHWILLADSENEAVAWLQSIVRPEVAMPVASPRRFVEGYCLRVDPTELDGLRLTDEDETYILAVIGNDGEHWTLNLKAPIVFNLGSRRGRQVVAQDDQPLQLILSGGSPFLRKAA
jgi:flagellar assembly factor FliW